MGWRRARIIKESTKVSDLTRVPSRSTQSGTLCLDRHWRLHNLKFGHSEQFSRCHAHSKEGKTAAKNRENLRFRG